MPSFCCIVGCGSRGDRDLCSFSRLPNVLNFKHRTDLNELSKLRREKWLRAIKRQDFTESKIKYARVCGKHFISGKAAELLDKDNPDWIPSLNMGYKVHRDITKAVERSARLEERNKKLLRSNHQEAGAASEEVPVIFEEEQAMEESINNGVSTQTNLTMDKIGSLFLKLSVTNTIQQRLDAVILSFDSLMGDDIRCKYYTGFTRSIFKIIVEDLKPLIPTHHNTKLAAADQIVLAFAKLRKSYEYKDLSFRFLVKLSPTVVSTYFKSVINIMFDRFQDLVFWPTREELRKAMPNSFKEAFHDNTSVIIDCFEIKIETPANPYAAAQCWSNYKHHSTVKYLIGITPQGTISFISDGWGGRVSDKFLTVNSKFLDLLCPGDIILADRGFLIKEYVELFQATVKTPAFTKGKDQLHPVDLENSRSIASVRIHVERVIGMIRKKYKIVQGVMPMSTVNCGSLDQIVFVCCALINMCPSIVPLD